MKIFDVKFNYKGNYNNPIWFELPNEEIKFDENYIPFNEIVNKKISCITFEQNLECIDNHKKYNKDIIYNLYKIYFTDCNYTYFIMYYYDNKYYNTYLSITYKY
jgi:hypothetical protein